MNKEDKNRIQEHIEAILLILHQQDEDYNKYKRMLSYVSGRI